MAKLTENQVRLLRWCCHVGWWHWAEFVMQHKGSGNASTLRSLFSRGWVANADYLPIEDIDGTPCQVIIEYITPAGRAALVEWEGNNA